MLITKHISYNQFDNSEYKDQILTLLKDKYENKLNFKLSPNMMEYINFVIVIDEDNNDVLSVSGVSEKFDEKGRIKFLATKDSTNQQETFTKIGPAIKKVLSEVFHGENYGELTETLFKKLKFLLKDKVYYYPAHEASKILQNRKMYVSDNGVTYEKFVHGAYARAKKIFISSNPNLNGAKGYKTFDEASSAGSAYKNKFIVNKYGKIIELPFDKQIWENLPFSDANNKIDNLLKLAAKYEVLSKESISKYDLGLEYPEYFMHFSDDPIGKNTLGINTGYSYNTPVGIYGYPAIENFDKLPEFARDRKYIFIFSVNGNILYMNDYTENDYNKDKEILKNTYELDNDFINKSESSSKDSRPIGKLWNLTRLISKSPTNWSGVLRELGYDAIYDENNGLIHSAEETQIVVINPKSIVHENTFYLNKKVKLIENINSAKPQIQLAIIEENPKAIK